MSLRRYTRAVPFNYTTYGMYRLGVTTGIIPATPLAAGEIFQFRWNPTNRDVIAIINRIRLSVAVSTTYWAAGVPLAISLTRASAWSVAGTAGTAVTPAATCKLDSSMASTNLVAGDCRIAGTDAAGLGAGTKTLEANFMGSVVFNQPITASVSPPVMLADLFESRVGDGGHPIILRAGAAAANAEGIAIRATAPATGTWRASVEIEWAESTDYPYGDSR